MKNTTEKELINRISDLENALIPFAKMHRPETNEDEHQLIVQRGHASDMTCIFGSDFRVAYNVLNEGK